MMAESSCSCSPCPSWSWNPEDEDGDAPCPSWAWTREEENGDAPCPSWISDKEDGDSRCHSWTSEEDALRLLLKKHGLSARSAESCGVRCCNDLAPVIRGQSFTDYEEKWVPIARFLEGLTNTAVKNRWNATLKRRLLEESGLPPMKRSRYADDNGKSHSEVVESVGGSQGLYPFFPSWSCSCSSNHAEEGATFFDCGKDDHTTELTLGLPLDPHRALLLSIPDEVREELVRSLTVYEMYEMIYDLSREEISDSEEEEEELEQRRGVKAPSSNSLTFYEMSFSYCPFLCPLIYL